MSGKIAPVETGQWRTTGYVNVVEVLRPHPRRPGFWLCVNSVFPHDIQVWGRRELEGMRIVGGDYFGAGGHPGKAYQESLARALRDDEERK